MYKRSGTGKVVQIALLSALFTASSVGFAHGKTTIKLWHIWGGNRGPAFAEVLKGFEKANPDIKVDSTFIGEPTVIGPKVLSSVIANAAPDVLMINIDIYGKLAGSGVLEPLDKYMAVDKVKKSDWYPGIIGTAVYNNNIYGLPAIASGPMVIYKHKQIYREVGLDPEKGPNTWDELVEVSKKMIVKQGNNLKRVGWNPFNIQGYFFQRLGLNNTHLLNADATKVAFDSDAGVETAQWFVDFATKVYNGKYLNSGLYQDNGLIKGTQGIEELGVYFIPQLTEYAPKLEYSIIGSPVGPRGLASETRGGGWVYSVTRSSKKKQAAWKLAEYLGWGDGQFKFTLDQQRPSVIKKHNENPEYAKRTPYWDIVSRITEEAYAPAAKPLPAGWSEISDLVVANMNKAMAQQISARDAMVRSATEANKILARYQRKK